MDRKKLVLLIAALVIAVGTALIARSMFAGASAPQADAAARVEAQGPKVLVAQRALPVGTIITADAIGFQLWPEELVQDAYFLDGEARSRPANPSRRARWSRRAIAASSPPLWHRACAPSPFP